MKTQTLAAKILKGWRTKKRQAEMGKKTVKVKDAPPASIYDAELHEVQIWAFGVIQRAMRSEANEERNASARVAYENSISGDVTPFGQSISLVGPLKGLLSRLKASKGKGQVREIMDEFGELLYWDELRRRAVGSLENFAIGCSRQCYVAGVVKVIGKAQENALKSKSGAGAEEALQNRGKMVCGVVEVAAFAPKTPEQAWLIMSIPFGAVFACWG